MLGGADEDPLVGPRRAEAGQIQRRDVVDPRSGRREQSQADRMPQDGPTGTTGRGGEEPEVTLEPEADHEFQAQRRRRGRWLMVDG
jgi:hypothetical protein